MYACLQFAAYHSGVCSFSHLPILQAPAATKPSASSRVSEMLRFRSIGRVAKTCTPPCRPKHASAFNMLSSCRFLNGSRLPSKSTHPHRQSSRSLQRCFSASRGPPNPTQNGGKQEWRRGQRKAQALRPRWIRCTAGRCPGVGGTNATSPAERGATPTMMEIAQRDFLGRVRHGEERLSEFVLQNLLVVAVSDAFVLDFPVEHLWAHGKLPLSSADVLIEPVDGLLFSGSHVLTPVVRTHSRGPQPGSGPSRGWKRGTRSTASPTPCSQVDFPAGSAPRCTEGTGHPRGRRGR